MIEVSYDEVDRAKQAWSTQAETLTGATLRIAKVNGGGLSARVAAEVRRFGRRWHTEIDSLATLAQDNADAFVFVKGTYEVSDLQQAERIRSLLPWADRHDPIRTA